MAVLTFDQGGHLACGSLQLGAQLVFAIINRFKRLALVVQFLRELFQWFLPFTLHFYHLYETSEF